MHVALVAESMDMKRVGAIISLNRYVSWLRQEGIKITIISTGEPAPDMVVVKPFYPFYMRNALKDTDFVFADPDPEILENTFKTVDIVHVCFPFQLGKAAVKIARKMKKPLLVSVHVQPENLLFAVKAEKIKPLVWLVYKMFITSVFNKADIIHCPSQFAANELRRRGCKRPMQVISNGIPKYIKAESLPKPKDLSDRFVIFCHGRFAREKRQCDLIDAVARSKYKNKIKLIISGKGPTGEALRIQAANLLDDAEITYLPDEELIRTLKFADLFVHSSLIDLESLSCLEAIGSGMVPLIAKAKASASSQFALDERSLFPVGDISALTQKIDFWIEHQDDLVKMKKKYVEFSKQYSAEETTKAVINLYNNLLKNYSGA